MVGRLNCESSQGLQSCSQQGEGRHFPPQLQLLPLCHLVCAWGRDGIQLQKWGPLPKMSYLFLYLGFEPTQYCSGITPGSVIGDYSWQGSGVLPGAGD